MQKKLPDKGLARLAWLDARMAATDGEAAQIDA